MRRAIALAEGDAESGSCIKYVVAGWLGADLDRDGLDDVTEIAICAATNVYMGDNAALFD